MPVIISGIKVSGLRGAANAIEKQFEHIAQEFPEMAGIHRWGTLNIVLDYPLRINNPDHTTRPIEWTPGVKEQFSLTKIGLQLMPQTAPPVDAWIYVAHESPHRGNALQVEILAPTMAISDGSQVLVYLPPYRYSSCVVL